MTLAFIAMPTAEADRLRNGGADAYGRLPETEISTGPGYPCRHCLKNIDAGEAVLVLSYRPFPELQPYAETGPIFLHKENCRRYAAEEILPPVLSSPEYIVRGYSAENRIVYGSGAVMQVEKIAARAEELLARDDIAYVHVRSARNNCYLCRIDKVEAPVFAEAALAI